ncbi:response regulator [bacterium]|nr:MAG: response regulator [bacterium]
MTNPGLRVLVVDDEKAIRRYLRAALSMQDITVLEASTGNETLRSVAVDRPDVVILDLGLPDMEGTEVTRQIRDWSEVPIIILSVREQENEKIAALDAGADDYLTKPFGTGELMARIRAALRRSVHKENEPVIEVNRLKIDLERRQVIVADHEISLTPTEYDILRLLAQNLGKVMTHRQLLNNVWGHGSEEDLHLLRVNISNLRHKIEPDPSRPRYIRTEAGVGYRLRSET